MGTVPAFWVEIAGYGEIWSWKMAINRVRTAKLQVRSKREHNGLYQTTGRKTCCPVLELAV